MLVKPRPGVLGVGFEVGRPVRGSMVTCGPVGTLQYSRRASVGSSANSRQPSVMVMIALRSSRTPRR